MEKSWLTREEKSSLARDSSRGRKEDEEGGLEDLVSFHDNVGGFKAEGRIVSLLSLFSVLLVSLVSISSVSLVSFSPLSSSSLITSWKTFLVDFEDVSVLSTIELKAGGMEFTSLSDKKPVFEELLLCVV